MKGRVDPFAFGLVNGVTAHGQTAFSARRLPRLPRRAVAGVFPANAPAGDGPRLGGRAGLAGLPPGPPPPVGRPGEPAPGLSRTLHRTRAGRAGAVGVPP